MPVLTPDLLQLMAQDVLDCVCLALENESPCGCPCRKCVVFGPPVWDDCCSGQLTIWVERIYVAAKFPQTDGQPITCAAPLAADFVLQLIRCVPTVDDNGVAPSCEAISASAAKIYQEMYIVERALLCCLAAFKKNRAFVMKDMRPIGPQGGCAGFEVRFTVEMIDPIPAI